MTPRSPLRTLLMAFWLSLTGCAATGHSTSGNTPTEPVIEDLEAADQAMERGDLDEAERLYRELTGEAPDLISPQFQLGVIAYQQRRLDDARRAFEAVRDRDRGHVLATHNLAIVHLEAARQLLLEHQRLAPVSAQRPTLVEIRRALHQLGEDHTAAP